jgi:hypothetical protein
VWRHDTKVQPEFAAGGQLQEPVITDVPFGAAIKPFRQATPKEVVYHGHWNADFSRMSSFVTDFRCEGYPGVRFLVEG